MLRGNAGTERRTQRTGYVVMAVVAAVAFVLVAAVAFVASSSTERARAAAGEANVAGSLADQDAGIVAVWSGLRVGWIYVYADGRVVLRHDSGRMVTDDGDIHYGIIQRHLSPVGMQLVRSGAVDFEELLFERVEHHDLALGLPQCPHGVGADVAGTAGDEGRRSHGAALYRSPRDRSRRRDAFGAGRRARGVRRVTA